jgi:hypothetical protein
MPVFRMLSNKHSAVTFRGLWSKGRRGLDESYYEAGIDSAGNFGVRQQKEQLQTFSNEERVLWVIHQNHSKLPSSVDDEESRRCT